MEERAVASEHLAAFRALSLARVPRAWLEDAIVRVVRAVALDRVAVLSGTRLDADVGSRPQILARQLGPLRRQLALFASPIVVGNCRCRCVSQMWRAEGAESRALDASQCFLSKESGE